MARRVRAVSHEDRLTLVEHLDELRTRIVVCIVVFGVALALCFWQNHLLLEIATGPLPGRPQEAAHLRRHRAVHDDADRLHLRRPDPLDADPGSTSSTPTSCRPSATPRGGSCCRSCSLAPLLFLAGVAFAYFVVMPAAVKFLLNFNDSQFNIQVRARDYYSFFSTTMLAGGVVFELPLAILAVTRLGIVKVEQLRANRRYAYLVIAIVAAALPGVDPVSMLIEMVPLLVLYELSILLARAFGTPAVAGAMGEPSTQE